MQPRLKGIIEPLRGILSIPSKHHKASNNMASQGSLVRPLGCCGAGLAGEAGEGEIGVYSTYLDRQWKNH